MTFLSQLGKIVLKIVQVATGIGPLLTAAAPNEAGVITTATNDFTAIATIIAQVEAIGQALTLTGTQKLTAAGPLVAQAVLSSELLVGRSIADPVKFQNACSGIASNVADLLNSLKADVKTVSKG